MDLCGSAGLPQIFMTVQQMPNFHMRLPCIIYEGNVNFLDILKTKQFYRSRKTHISVCNFLSNWKIKNKNLGNINIMLETYNEISGIYFIW